MYLKTQQNIIISTGISMMKTNVEMSERIHFLGLTYYHKHGGLREQKCILSQFCRLEVWNQGGGRAILSPVALGTNPSLAVPASSDGGQQTSAFLGWKMQNSNHCPCLHITKLLCVPVFTELSSSVILDLGHLNNLILTF